jgi:hypothetical protein
VGEPWGRRDISGFKCYSGGRQGFVPVFLVTLVPSKGMGNPGLAGAGECSPSSFSGHDVVLLNTL